MNTDTTSGSLKEPCALNCVYNTSCCSNGTAGHAEVSIARARTARAGDYRV